MDNLDRHIRYFLAIAKHSSLSKAAEELDLTQSGLSRQLAALERFLGKPLFLRTGRGVALTDAGVALRRDTEERYRYIDAAVEAIKEREGVSEGNLRIAAIHTLSYYFVADLLARFMSQRGHVNLSVLARSSPDVVSLVEKGQADIGFVYDSAVASDRLESVPLFDDGMCLIGKQEDFAGQTDIDLMASDQPLIGFPGHYALRRMLKSAGLDGRVVAEAETIDAMLQLVSSGIGSCILPEQIPSQLLAEYHLAKLPLVRPVLKRRVVAIVRNNAPAPSMARQLLEMAQGSCGGLSATPV
jgi:DNA-binding transcriptional LysR family regulator